MDKKILLVTILILFTQVAAGLELSKFDFGKSRELKPQITKITVAQTTHYPQFTDPIKINLHTNTLAVEFNPLKPSQKTYYSTLEMWALTDIEIDELIKGKLDKDAGNARLRQFIYLPYASGQQIVLSKIEDADNKGNEWKDKKKNSWQGLKFTDYLNYIKHLETSANIKYRFYLLIGSSTNEINRINSEPVELELVSGAEAISTSSFPEESTALLSCTSILECLARINKKFIESIVK